jgi:RNA-binding protein
MPLNKLGEIGEVMHLAKSGRLIVKLNAAGAGIKAGEILIDGSSKRIGRVAELLGPVSAPYASVIPMTDRTSKLVGAKIFSGGFTRSSSASSKSSSLRNQRRQRPRRRFDRSNPKAR